MNTEFSGQESELNARVRRIDLAHQSDFPLGQAMVQPSLRRIKGPAGEIMLEPKVMQVLVALADPIGMILSRDDLIERCWEGRIVGDTSINRVISLLRAGLKKAAGDGLTIENVPKVGYRLVAAANFADVSSDDPDAELAGLSDGQSTRLSDRLPQKMVLAALAVITACVLAFAFWPSNSSSPVERLRVAMLPLEYSDGVDPLYARGLEAELRSQIARVGAMEVSTSESARSLAEGGLAAADIGRKLGVDYVWSGRLISKASRVGLSVQLVQAKSGETVWEDELFSAPGSAEHLPLRTAREMAVVLGRQFSEGLSEAPVSAGDYRLYLTALGLIKGRGIEQRRAALEIMQQVTAQNPQFADGWAGLAKAWFLYPDPVMANNPENRATALKFARHALSLDENSVDGLKVAGMLEEDGQTRLAMLNRAVEVDSGDTEAWYWLSITQRDFILQADSPLQSSLRMVEIDPLWPATWGASDLAAEFAQMDVAREIETDIQSAAVTPSQQYMTEARLLRLDGDLSGYLELDRRAAMTKTEAERRFGSSIHIILIKYMLDLPINGEDTMKLKEPQELMVPLHSRILPTREEFAARGFGGANFWNSHDVVLFALPLFLETDREAELIEYFDARFANHEAYLDFAGATGEAHDMIPSVSPYLAVALRRAGRQDEAAAHLASTEEQIARWKEADTGWITPHLYELQLAAAQGDMPRAIALVELLPEFGWPYTMGHTHASTVSLLRDDSLFTEVQQEPEIRAVLDPIRANLAKEREEVLALGR